MQAVIYNDEGDEVGRTELKDRTYSTGTLGYTARKQLKDDEGKVVLLVNIDCYIPGTKDEQRAAAVAIEQATKAQEKLAKTEAFAKKLMDRVNAAKAKTGTQSPAQLAARYAVAGAGNGQKR